MITDAKILVVGVSGTVAQRLAVRLAVENEVWGLARFAHEEPGDLAMNSGTAPAASRMSRRELEAAGVVTRAVDLAHPALLASRSDV